MAKLDILAHPFPPQIQVAVVQAGVLIHFLFLGDQEGSCLGRVKDTDAFDLDFDIAGRKVRVFGPGRAALDRARHLDHPFRPGCTQGRMGIRRDLRVGDDLHQPETIA